MSEACKHPEWIPYFESVAPMHAVSYFCRICGTHRPSSDRCNKGVKQDTITPKPTSGLTPYDDIYKIILKYQESVNTKLIWELVDYMKAVVSRFSQKKVTKEQIADAVNSHYFYYKGFGIDEGYKVGSHISQECKDKLIDNIYKSIEGKTK